MADTGDLKSPQHLPQPFAGPTPSDSPPPALAPLLTFSGRAPVPVDTELARAIDLWPELPEVLRHGLARWRELPEAIRRAILALVETCPVKDRERG